MRWAPLVLCILHASGSISPHERAMLRDETVEARGNTRFEEASCAARDPRQLKTRGGARRLADVQARIRRLHAVRVPGR